MAGVSHSRLGSFSLRLGLGIELGLFRCVLILFGLFGGLLGLQVLGELVRGIILALGVPPGSLGGQGAHADSGGEDVRPRKRQDGTTQHDGRVKCRKETVHSV